MYTNEEECERRLWIASRQYVQGEIPIDELEEIENIQSENLRRAFLSLARKTVIGKLLATVHSPVTRKGA
ncbi:MAG TPA: hypothetical protein VKY19_29200 [Ktedonosporobacter sp.]|jgi:hypothetical protein|nr:hypothetical protein [Ktedonosporobacter sp.]